MSAAVEAVIAQWAVPRMRARRFRATVLADNAASVRVFEKTGFQNLGIAPVNTQEEHLAEVRSEYMLELTVDEEDVDVQADAPLSEIERYFENW